MGFRVEGPGVRVEGLGFIPPQRAVFENDLPARDHDGDVELLELALRLHGPAFSNHFSEM